MLPNAFTPSGTQNGYHYFNPDGEAAAKGTIKPYKQSGLRFEPIYSNEEWNKEYNGLTRRFIAVNAEEGIIYGMEDGQDRSYEDILFMITSIPKGAIEEPEIPDLEPVDPKEETAYNYYTYAFEDIWPDGGDYDLNDVIIDHKRTITFTEDNLVTKVVDEFTPVQPSNAATYINAFGVQIEAVGTRTGDATYESGGSCYLLSQNTTADRGKTSTIIRTFGNGLDKSFIDKEDLNPFIVSQFTSVNAAGRTEIHLPKGNITKLADESLQNTKDDAYFINKDGKHPFALKFMWEAEGQGFTPVTEKVCISDEYPDFDKWVEKGCGEEYADWYKNYQKK